MEATSLLALAGTVTAGLGAMILGAGGIVPNLSDAEKSGVLWGGAALSVVGLLMTTLSVTRGQAKPAGPPNTSPPAPPAPGPPAPPV